MTRYIVGRLEAGRKVGGVVDANSTVQTGCGERFEPAAHLLAEALHLAVVLHLVCLAVRAADFETLQRGSWGAGTEPTANRQQPAAAAEGGCCRQAVWPLLFRSAPALHWPLTVS